MAKQQKSQKASKSARGRRGREEFDDAAPTRERVSRPKSDRLNAQESEQRRMSRPLTCKNDAQKDYLRSIIENQVTVAIGPAGTGKTYVSVKQAAIELDARNVERIVVVRPIVEAGGGLGFLPGDEGEKTAPYQVPFLEVLEEHYGPGPLQAKMGGQFPTIMFVPPEFIRGRTFKDAFVILDEAQNMTCDQMKTFLTRLGEDTKCVLQGDIEQVDIQGKSGLEDAMEILEGLPNVGTVEFTEDDIVRSGFCKAVLLRYRRRKNLSLAAAANDDAAPSTARAAGKAR